MAGAGKKVLPGPQRIGRYVLQRELGHGGTGVVYEARDSESHAVVALKTLVSMDGENLFRLKHEFRSLANLEHETFVRFGELACESGQWFFTMERIYGSDFLRHVRAAGGVSPGASVSDSDPARTAASTSHVRASVEATEPVASSEGAALGLALDEARLRAALSQLIDGLAALHEVGRLHRDVKPSNVLVTEEGRLVLLDFGLMAGFGSNDAVVGTPAYMAPEQIAGNALSPATDWYAVGVMLFVALTGRLPFDGPVLDILHAKLREDAPRDWGDGLPEDLRSLCTALLERDPHKRPSVDEIRSRLGLTPAARASMREVFVGRDAELGRLRAALPRARGRGLRVLVRGEPGMGKSALVERFLSELPDHTLVLRGRCYEQETIPFGAVDALVDGISEYLWGLEPNDVDRLIAGGVSNVARVFPVLCRIPSIAAQALGRAVENPEMLREPAFHELGALLRALSRSRQLVFFLDDLQWADPDSLALVRRALLATDGLLVATVRAPAPQSPELAELVAGFEVIDIRGLSPSEAGTLLETLGVAGQEGLRDLAVRQADGHPLLLKELARSERYEPGALRSFSRLQDVLWGRISRRDSVDREFLEIVSLAGAPSEYSVLARAAGLDVGECFTRLAALRAAQLVRATRVGVERLVEPYHDRIRETMLEHLDDEQPGRGSRLHLQLARALLAATTDATLPGHIFSIVEHMSHGRELLSPSEWERLAELNLLASEQALLATAFERARHHAAAGVQCLERVHGDAGAWSHRPKLCRDLYLARLQGEYRTGQRDLACGTLEALKARLADPVERAEIIVSWIGLESNGGFAPQAVEAGREILRDLGARLPSRTTPLHVLLEYVLARRAQRGRRAEELASLPALTDRRLRSVLRIIAALVAPAFQTAPELTPWLTLRIAHISMERGLSETSPYGFACYGMVLAGAFAKYEEALEFGAMAVALADRDDNPRVRARTHYMNATFIVLWVAGYERLRQTIDRSIELSRACGDTEYEAYGHTTEVLFDLTTGADVAVMIERAERAREFAVLCKADACRLLVEGILRYARALRGETRSLVDYGLPDSSHEEFVNSQTAGGVVHGHLCMAETAYLVGDVARAERLIAPVHRQIHQAFSAPGLVDIWFVSALIAAGGYERASTFGRIKRRLYLARAIKKLEAWAMACPGNCEVHAKILRAETLRLRGREGEATRAYEEAIASARAQKTPKREAIACELAAKHLDALGDAARAGRYRQQAIDAYRRWGATAKVAALEAGGPIDAETSSRVAREASSP